MCTGMEVLALASLASSAGGTGMQIASQNKKRDAMQDATRAERARQDIMDEERFSNFQEALGRIGKDRIDTEASAAAGERTQQLNEAAGVGEGTEPVVDYNVSPALAAPKVIQDYAQKGADESTDFVRALGEAKGRMGGWGDAMFDFGRDFGGLNRRNQDLRRQARKSGEIGAIEAQEAYDNSGNTMANFGNLLSTAGTVGSFAAGAGGGWGDLFTRGGNALGARMIPASPYF